MEAGVALAAVEDSVCRSLAASVEAEVAAGMAAGVEAGEEAGEEAGAAMVAGEEGAVVAEAAGEA